MRAHLVPAAAALVLCAATTLAQPGGLRERARPKYLQGLEFMKLEAWPEAAKAFQEAIDIDPEYDWAYYQLGRADMNMKRFSEAIAAYSKAREVIRTQGGRAYASFQDAQRFRGDRITEIDEAIRSYQSGPQTPQALESIRQLQEQRRQIQEIIQRGNSTMSIDVKVPAYISVALGSAYFRSGRLAEAEREYKAAIDSDAKAGEAHNNLAVVYLETGRIRDAETEVKLAEKAGFRVHPQLKAEIQDRRK